MCKATTKQQSLCVCSAEETMMDGFLKIRAIVFHDGRVHWEPGGNFRTTCNIDIYYFPFDQQHCEIIIGAWVYHSAKMNVTNISADVNTDNFTLNGEWELLDTVRLKDHHVFFSVSVYFNYFIYM